MLLTPHHSIDAADLPRLSIDVADTIDAADPLTTPLPLLTLLHSIDAADTHHF